MNDSVVISLATIAAIAAISVALMILFPGESKSHPILTGRLVEQTAESFTIEWCEQHAKVSDYLIQTTFEWLPRPDGRTDVWRRTEQVGTC